VIQQIPLDGGLVTQADAEEVGFRACTELVNAEFDKLGLLYKRLGRSSATAINANVNEIIRWIAPDGTAYWIVCTTTGQVYRATSLDSLTDIFDSTGTRVRISNYGSLLRFANGAGYSPKVYQYIDRDFFWWDGSTYGFNPTPAFNIDTSIPRAVDFSLVQCGALVTDLTTNMAHSTKTYQYKLTFVYDGNQEPPLPKLSAVSSNMALEATSVANTGVFFFDVLFNENEWNSRITGINVYRKQGSGAYYKIASCSTLSRDEDNNLQSANGNGLTENVLLDSSGGFTSAINNRVAYINGLWHPISATGYKNPEIAYMSQALNVSVGGNTWGTLTGHTNLIFDNNGASLDANDVGGWFIGYDIANGNTGILDGIGGLVGFWGTTGGAITVTKETGTIKGRTNLTKIAVSNNSLNEAYYSLGFTGLTGSDSIIVGFYFIMDGCAGSGATVQVGIGDTSGTIDKLIVDHTGSGSSGGAGDQDKWRWCQVEILLTSLAGYGDGDTLYLIAKINDNISSNATLWLDNIVASQKIYNPPTGRLGAGDDVVASTSFDLGAEDSAMGWGVQVGGVNQGIGTIKKNYQYGFKHQVLEFSDSTTQNVFINRNYNWQDLGTTHRFSFRDLDETEGAVHPTGETSIEVYYTYSVNLDGRNYVADVALNPTAENETHPDWVMFSELSQPDVIPITNYISIPDLQGGSIKGLAKLIGDLVVFQEKGIYRLSIPSTDPTAWSLSESEANIGCIAPDSIVEYEAGVFFAGNDHFYYLDSNFTAVPVTQTIKDDYQAIANLQNTRAMVDVKKNRLMVKFGDSNSTIYSLDLLKLSEGDERWTQLDLTGGKNADLFGIDEDLNFYTIESGATSYLAELNPTSPSESTSFKRTTGWISVGDLDRHGILRRLNLRYKSADSIEAKIYADGDKSTVVKTITIPADTTGSDWYKCKPSVRCRYFMIELNTTATTNAVEIRRMEFEFE
tara:strand:- start:386 stop:3277 length:2892 start_codon:yes stop_codon:yes gene_type:complete